MKYSMCADIMYVRVGEHGPLWPDTDGILEAMELAKQNGLQGIEFFDWESRDLGRIAAKAKELQLEVVAFCAKGATLLGDPAQLGTLVEGFRQSVQAAKVLGCKRIILNGEDYPRDLPREAVYQTMIDGLRSVAPIAEAAGVTVLVEPITGSFFQSAAEAFGLIDAAGSAHVKLLYDIFHFQNIEGNITNTIKANLDKIGHIHGAGAPMRCELTVGEINYSYILPFLQELGYDKYFGLEFFTFQNRDEKVAASCGVLV